MGKIKINLQLDKTISTILLSARKIYELVCIGLVSEI